jgi:hypothetical protein
LLFEVIQGLRVVVGDELVVHMNGENEKLISSVAVVVTGIRVRRGDCSSTD